MRAPNTFRFFVAFLLTLLFACTRPASPGGQPWSISSDQERLATPGEIPTAIPIIGNPDFSKTSQATPTPDLPHGIPNLRTEPEIYVVQSGDTLGLIADRYNVAWEQIAEQNNLTNPNLLSIGQTLEIPAPPPVGTAPGFKIIPDSELVYGPETANFDMNAFIQQQGGYLWQYLEEVDDQIMTGSQIVDRIARNYSVNPRLLLAVIEYQSEWVTNSSPPEETQDYPIGFFDPSRTGLYRQLAWAADNLNRGFYLWRVDGIGGLVLTDNSLIAANPTINAGTAGVQHLFAQLYGLDSWKEAITENGIQATFSQMFDYPFTFSVQPLLPPDLAPPMLQLPFEEDKVWAFTGGPHGGWDNGSAWAALDFGPPGEALGCVQSEEWVVAMANGIIIRAANGAVVQDLDGDGLEGTGWTILYMHIESRDRVQPGAQVKQGDRIGHPSCEGGLSSGTHVHIARRYNGEWIPADQTELPFVMDGWVSSGTGILYDGFLSREGERVEAFGGNSEMNEIQR